MNCLRFVSSLLLLCLILRVKHDDDTYPFLACQLSRGMSYHFRSKFLNPTSRRSTRNDRPLSTSSRPKQTRNTFTAIEKFVNIQLLILGFLQLLAVRFPFHIWSQSRCCFRSYSSDTPSAFVTRTAFSNIIRGNLYAFRKERITKLILDKQDFSIIPALQRKVGEA